MTVAIPKTETYLKLKGLQVYSIRNEGLKLQTNLMTVYQWRNFQDFKYQYLN